MRQSRFKQIVSEEFALARVGLREAAGPSKHSNVITVLRQALDALTTATHDVGDAAARLKPFDPEHAATIDSAYDAIYEQVKLIGAAFKAARMMLPEEK